MREGWPAEAQARRVGDSFGGEVHQLEVANDGRTWVIRIERTSGARNELTTTLEVFGVDGRRERALVREPGVLPWQFVLHPSGEATLFELAPDGREFRLRVRRLNDRRVVLHERAFADEGSEHERIYYDTNRSEILDVQPIGDDVRLDRWPNPLYARVEAVAIGEDVAFVASMFGVKLYRLSPTLEQRWATQALASDFFIGTQGAEAERLVVLDGGSLLLGAGVLPSQAEVFRRHFSLPLTWRGGGRDVLVQQFSAQGVRERAQLFGGDGDEWNVAALAMDAGELVIAAGEDVTKSTRENDTREWDLLLMRGSLEDGTLSLMRRIDLGAEEWLQAFAIAPNGDYVWAGTAGFVQADTYSWVQNGSGLLLRTSRDGDSLDRLDLRGPRHVTVSHVAFGSDGTLHFAGEADAPLTHTVSDEWYSHAVLGRATLSSR